MLFGGCKVLMIKKNLQFKSRVVPFGYFKEEQVYQLNNCVFLLIKIIERISVYKC